MGERITSISMEAFRGVPGSFTIDLGRGGSFVVLGDNGTGKSTIADALEWYFRGQIEILTKENRGDAIRHSGASPELETKVTVATDGSLGGSITISQESPEAARDVGRSDMFLLRGRTLAEFVDKTKGEKWQVLAELLGLEALDQMRLDLQRTRNELENAAQSARTELQQRRAALSQHVAVVSEEGVLTALGEKCAAAGVERPDKLDDALDRQWIQRIAPARPQDQLAVTLGAIMTDLRAAAAQPVLLDPIAAWNRFIEEGRRADQLRLSLHQAADSLLKSGHAEPDKCPLCRQPVNLQALADGVTSELEGLEGAARELEAAQQAARQCSLALRSAYQKRSDIARRARERGIDLAALPMDPSNDLATSIEGRSSLDEAKFECYERELASWDTEALAAVEAAIPGPATARDQTLVELGALITETSAWRSATGRELAAGAAFGLADRVFKRFQQRQHEYFSSLVEEVSGRTAEIYQFLHPEAGVSAVAVETIGDKGAELSVEFHGRKELPPHRVLSESHLNSLGVALFLAMAETFNEQLEFLVLDDVVNSFDREHRGRLADLLVDQFDGIQLIVLTHDEQFYTRLCRRAPSWTQDHFTSWSYGDGPRTKRYEGVRLLAEAEEALAAGDRTGAAQKGRRALEEFLQEACEALEAPLPFRRGVRNDQRMAEEVMRGLRRTLRDGAKQLYADIEPLLTELEADLQASLNVEAHGGPSGSSNQEVRDALRRIAELGRHFDCGECGTRIWHHGTPSAARCKCGRASFPPAPPA